MTGSEYGIKASLDRVGDAVVLTLVVPNYLAVVIADVAVELRRACEIDGSDIVAAELAGVLVGILDGVPVG